MSFAKNNSASTPKKAADGPRVTVEMLHNLHAVVRNVRQVADNCLTFTLRLYGIDLYGMRLVEGEKSTFITATPKRARTANTTTISVSTLPKMPRRPWKAPCAKHTPRTKRNLRCKL